MKLKPAAGHLLFTLLILSLFVIAVYSSRSWPVQARLFPSAICIPGAIFCVIQLVVDIWRAQHSRFGQDTRRIMDLPVDRDVSLSQVMRRAASIWGWVLGFFAGTWLLGFVISTPVFMWLYLTFQAREKWLVSLSATGVVFVLLVTVFHYILHVPWIPGAIPGPQEAVLRWIGNVNLY